MAIKTRDYLKNRWVKGYKPVESDYADLFDSSVLMEDVDSLDTLPSQEGASGLFLTTNGVQAFWDNIQGGVGADGENASSYWLISPSSLYRDKNLNYVPSTITFTAMSQTGSASPVRYNGRFRIVENGTNIVYVSSSPEASASYTPTNPNLVTVTCQLYNASGLTLLDEEIIPISYSTPDSVTLDLINDSSTVPTNLDGTDPVYTNTTNELRVTQGISGLTYDGVGTANGTWTVVSAIGVNITAGIITDSGDFASVGAASGMSLESDTASITFTVSGMTTDGYPFTRTKTQTISKNKNGGIGLDATNYWLISSTEVVSVLEGSYSPSAVTFTAMSQTGSGEPVPYAGRYQIIENESVTAYTSTGDELSYTHVITGTIDTITVKLFRSGGTITKLDEETIITLQSGTSNIKVDLINDNTSIPSDLNGDNPNYTYTGTDIKVYEGSDLLNYDGVGANTGTWTVISKVGIDITAGEVTENGLFATAGTASDLTNDIAIITWEVSGKTKAGKDFTASAVQKFSRFKSGGTGLDANTYWVVSSSQVIARDGETYNPSSITFSAMTQAGTADPTPYTGRYKVYENGAVTAAYSSSADESEYTHPISGDISSVEVKLYKSGGFTTRLDEETVIVLLNGTDAIQIDLTNDNATIPADKDNLTPRYEQTGTDIKVYQGSELLQFTTGTVTAGTWSLSASGIGIDYGSITENGLFATAGTASNMTIDFPSIIWTATGLSKNGTAFTVSSVQTFNRQVDSTIGADATVYNLRVPTIINRDKHLVYIPDTLSASAESQTGSGSPVPYVSGRYKFYWTSDNATWNEVDFSAPTSAYTTPSLSATIDTNSIQLKLELYNNAGTVVLDTEYVNISKAATDALIVDLSNDNCIVKTDTDALLYDYSGTPTEISVKQGTIDLEFTTGTVTAGTWTVIAQGVNIDAGAITKNGLNASVASASNITSQIAKINFSVSGRTTDDYPFILHKTQNVTLLVDGLAGGEVWWLTANAPVISKNASGEFTPSTLTFTSNTTSAGFPNTTKPATFKLYVNDSFTASAASATSISRVVSLNPNTLSIKCEMYTDDTFTTMIDSETLPVLTDGSSTVTIDLSNDNHTIPTASNGASGNYFGSGTDIKVYYGSQLLTYSPTGGTTKGTWRVESQGVNIDAGAITQNGLFATAATASNMNVDTDTGYITFSVTAMTYDGIVVTPTIQQGFIKNKNVAGTDATAYWLVSSTPTLVFNAANTFVPSNITFSGKSQTGIALPAPYAGVFKIYENNSGTPITTTGVTASTIVTPSSTAVNVIKCDFYAANGTTLLDTETVTVIDEKSDIITVELSNDNVTISCDASGNPLVGAYAYTGTEIRVFQGTNELTCSHTQTGASYWRATSSGSGITAGSISVVGKAASAAPAHSMLANTNVAMITYTVTGYSIENVFFSIRKVQTFSKSYKGIDGINGASGTNGAPGSNYYLVASTPTLKQNDDNSFNPTTVTFYHYASLGSNPPTLNTGYFKLFYNNNFDGNYQGTSVVATPNSTTTSITCHLYSDPSRLNKIDEETVVVLRDGEDTITVDLSNDSHTIPTDVNGNNGDYSKSGTLINVYQGATQLSHDGSGTNDGTWKVTSLGNGIKEGGINDAGSAASASPASGMTSDSATITYTITGKSLGGKFAINKTIVQSFAKAKAGDANLSGYISNPNYPVPTASDGTNPIYTYAGGNFVLNYGASAVTNSTSASFAVSGGNTAAGVSSKTQNGVTLSINVSGANAGAYTVSGASWTTDTETFTLQGTFKGTTLTYYYTVSKDKNNSAFKIAANKTMFTYTDNALDTGQSDITLSVSLNTMSGSATWSAFNALTNASLSPLTSVTASSCILTASDFNSTGVDQLRVVVTKGSLTDSILISKGFKTNATSDLTLINHNNTAIYGNKITKISGNTAAEDASAYSEQSYNGACITSFSFAQNNTTIAAGLSTNPSAALTIANIDYAWKCSNANLYTMVSGVQTDAGLSYTAGVQLSIVYDGNNITFIHDGVPKRTIAVGAGKKFYFDSSIVSVNSIIEDIRLIPTTTTSTLYEGNTPPSAANVGDTWLSGSGATASPWVPNTFYVCKMYYTSSTTPNATHWGLAADRTVTAINGGFISSGVIELGASGTYRQGNSGISGNGASGSSEVRFWAGKNFGNRATAPFRVLDNGSLYATNAFITGSVTATNGLFSGTITGSTISGTNIYGGTIQTSNSASGVIKINSTGISGIDSTGVTKFKVDASTGTLTAVNGYFSGTVTGTNTVTNNVTNIVGVTVSAGTVLGTTVSGCTLIGDTVTGGTITGTAISGGTIKGTTVSGCTLIGDTVTGGTIMGANIYGNTVTGGTISGTTITGTNIFGNTVTGGTITGSTIQTSSGSTSLIKLNSAGISGINSSGIAKFSVDTSGILRATDAILSGSVTATNFYGNVINTANIVDKAVQIIDVYTPTINSTSTSAGYTVLVQSVSATHFENGVYYNATLNISMGVKPGYTTTSATGTYNHFIAPIYFYIVRASDSTTVYTSSDIDGFSFYNDNTISPNYIGFNITKKLVYVVGTPTDTYNIYMKVRPHKAAKSGVAWNGTANNPITDNVFIEMRVNKNK